MRSDRNTSRRGHRFVPVVEDLEDRAVPAENVQAFVSDRVLYVAGDDAANQIWIAGAGPNSVVIRSLDGSTTINGQNAVLLGGINRGYHITMAGGDDVLLVTGTRSDGGLTVDLGEGNNVFGISDAGHQGNCDQHGQRERHDQPARFGFQTTRVHQHRWRGRSGQRHPGRRGGLLAGQWPGHELL
jgi:hypothetical protein